MALIIDGKKIAESLKNEIQGQVADLFSNSIKPFLSVILVGENPASQIYVKMKTRAAAELKIQSNTIELPAEVSQDDLLKTIANLNEDQAVHGILIQLPLPKHIDENIVLNFVSPEKDVDGFHPVNRGRLLLGEDTLTPCTPLGVQQMLLHQGHETEGKHVVIVGRSKIVGLPLATMLMQKAKGANATVTVCHTGTKNLLDFTTKADILIAAAGMPEMISGDMIKSGAVVIDVGVNRVEDVKSEKGYKIVGDVEFDSVSKVAAAISPVPGGVGPMTIAMLMHNTVKAAKLQSMNN